MEYVDLFRAKSSNQGTLPSRWVAPRYSCWAGELADHENASNISRVPEGDYHCRMTFSPHMKRWTYEVFGVPGRSSIRIHSATYMGDAPLRKQLNGCIALGEKFGTMDGQRCMLLSRPAVTKFENSMNRLPFLLRIKNGLV